MTNRVTVIGSLNVDTILEIPRLPKPGETLAMHNQSFAGGGKALTKGSLLAGPVLIPTLSVKLATMPTVSL